MRRALLKWYKAKARPLPWRATADPYSVWVSEVMLQQTQIATVIPYYERFLRAFPTAAHLARAPFDRVAALWSGLGYYRRARNLHLAAKQIMKEFEGKFPDDYDRARKLAGVGDYTASAVLSIAHGRPYVVLDGNVARVASRLFAIDGDAQKARFRREARRELEKLISRRSPGAFNQAMMELGQTVCLPRAPLCGECPLQKHCKARWLGAPEAFPAPRHRRAPERLCLAAAIIRKGDSVALTRGLEEGLVEDLWNFPAAFGRTAKEALDRLKEKLGAKSEPLKLGFTRHAITYRSIHVDCYEFAAAHHPAGRRWVSCEGFERMPVSQLARKIMALAGSEDGAPHSAARKSAGSARTSKPEVRAAGAQYLL